MKPTYELEDVQVTCGSHALPVAAVRLLGPEQEEVWATQHGNGPVDAAFKAIDSVVGVPNELVEFSIQAMTGGLDAVGRVLVRIRGQVPLGDTGRVQQREFLGRGADTDVIVASAKAYLFALNRLLAAQRASRHRLAATTEEVQKALDEMHARYGDFMGWRAMRDEDLF